jgi:pyridoxal phosphate enzyme (YggS family)
MDFEALGARLVRVRAEIAARQARGGWSHAVRVVAVTKTFGPDAVRAAAAAGLDAVGENRVQEALAKQDQCAGVVVAWHLIGTLQRNKVRQVIGRFALVHSLDRLELADEFQRRAPDIPQDVLVQVNCSGEPQKGGIEPANLVKFLDEVQAFPAVRVRGLMTMAALGAREPEQRRTFAQLRERRDAAQAAGHALTELSMGMSDDYGAAVEEGATMVRIGSALFGARD